MAMNAYLHLKGNKSGEIKGSCTQKGREGQIVVIESHHEVVSPRDAASGLPSGRRQHKPFVITKEVDKATPLLYQALVNNELISEFELHFWRPGIKAASGAGAEVQYYTVKLVNARIVDIAFTQPNTRDVNLQKTAELETVAFTYQHIEWIWVEGGITASDDAGSPMV
jgi:type VI secretion system secreted protein Hcp